MKQDQAGAEHKASGEPTAEPAPNPLAAAAIAAGVYCIGCGLPFAAPYSAAELRMLRPGPSGVAGYCDGCMGGRAAAGAEPAAAQAAMDARVSGLAKQAAEHKTKPKN